MLFVPVLDRMPFHTAERFEAALRRLSGAKTQTLAARALAAAAEAEVRALAKEF